MHYERVKAFLKSETHDSSKHKLPADFQNDFNRILKPGWKPWKSITDEALLKATAAWNWLLEFCVHKDFYDDRGVCIGGSLLSRLMLPLTVAYKRSAGYFYAMMGSHKYAAMAMRLFSFHDAGCRHFTFHHAMRRYEFIFVTDPLDWDIVPFQAVRLPGRGIVMQQDGDPLTLIRHTLRQPEHDLSEDDLTAICKCLALEPAVPADSDLDIKLQAIAKHFCGTDDINSEDVQRELALYDHAFACADDADEELLSDPLVEAVYDDLCDEDKGEFAELRLAKAKRKLKAKFQAGHDEVEKQALAKKNTKKRQKKESGEEGSATKKAKKGRKAKAKANATASAVDEDEPPPAAEAALPSQAATEAMAPPGEGSATKKAKKGKGKGKAKGKAKAKAKANATASAVDEDEPPPAAEAALPSQAATEAMAGEPVPVGDAPPPSPAPADDDAPGLAGAAVAAEAVAAAPASSQAAAPAGGPSDDADSDASANASTSSSSSSSSSGSSCSRSRSPSPAELEGKVHSYGNCTGWNVINCRYCSQVAGRWKHSTNYGLRDGPTYLFEDFSAKDGHA